MAEESSYRAASQDTELIKKFLKDDIHILQDVQFHRNHDQHKLLRRLETLLRNSPRIVVEDVGEREVHKFLECLVGVYFSCSESIKFSRAVEKLWQPYEDVYAEQIKSSFQKHLDDMIKEEATDNQALVRVSVLVEQNPIVQAVFSENLELYLSWAARKLVILTDIPPSELTKEEAQCLYSVVKICLQMFQSCGSNISTIAWSQDAVASNSTVAMATRQIAEKLIHILKTEGYPVDCVLLTGTATALLLNTIPDPRQAVVVFHRILHTILNPVAHLKSIWLWDKSCTRSATTQSDILKKLSESTISNLGPLALIRGSVACGRQEFLSYSCINNLVDHSANMPDQKMLKEELARNCDKDIVFVKLFHYICILCEGDLTLHYHAFQVLLLWFTRLTKLNSILKSSIAAHFPSISENTLKLVLLNMDSPIEDVPEAVMEIFSHLLWIWNQLETKGSDLPQIVLQKIMNTSWFVKGRYRLLSILLKYTDTGKVVLIYPQLQDELLRCLTTNHLTSAATTVYKAFLQEIIRTCPDAEEHKMIWSDIWLPLIVRGLVSQDSLLRHNTSLHWVPASFKLLPSTSAVLQHHLSAAMATPDVGVCRTRLLHAFVVVTKTIRMLFGTSDLTEKHILEGLYCGDDDVRSEAIALVCSTLKKAECISEIEVKLLKECLPHNVKIDSAPFRQQLSSSVRKLLVRLRDSCITLLKDTKKNEKALTRSITFVDWLQNLSIDNLLPGACYQRRKGSLDLLSVIYDTLVYCPDSRQRKGFTPEAATKLVQFAKSSGTWQFFSVENTRSLILCLLDGADEIQTIAADILTRYYPCLPDDTCCHLLRDTLTLCSSPRSHDSQSGAVMCKYIFQKYVLEQKYRLGFHYNDSISQYVVAISNSNDLGNSGFLQCWLDEISRRRTCAEKNLVEASRLYPIHGMILALTKCLTKVASVWQQEQPSLLPLTMNLVTSCCQVIDRTLEVMATVAGQEACPSFAEIGMALENLLLESQPDYTESTSLSPEYQYMLSYCWNNIKESSSCLGEVTNCLLANSQTLDHSWFQNVCDTFIKVLTKCRHKGVIEGARSAFIQFCSALFFAPGGNLHQIPEAVLTQVLLSLKKNIITSSVTRRSAGIPIIIQAILVSEKKTKKTVLLTRAVDELFEISSLPLDTDSGLTDLPQVHGLNILNSLFGDASLTPSLIGHISRTVILVIEKFGSPSWAIRNAATRLFSTLVTRLFGQRKDAITCNTVTFQEFSSYYPDLPPFVQQVLSETSQCDVSAVDQLDPRLFPVLTLLSCLKPMDSVDTNLHSTMNSIKNEIVRFIESPVFQLRHLVASALVAMVNMADMATVTKEFLGQINRPQKTLTCNKLHGLLLVISRLLDHIDRNSDLTDTWVELIKRRWLIEMPSLIASLYAKLLNRVLEKCPNLTEKETISDLLLSVLFLYNAKDLTELPVGYPVLCHEVVSLLFHAWECRGQSCIPLVPLLLLGTSSDIRKTCLECTRLQVETGRLNQSGLLHLQHTLVQHLKLETDIQNTVLVLEIITELYQRSQKLEEFENLSGWLKEQSEMLQKYTSLSSAALPVTAIVVRCETQDGYSEAAQGFLLCSLCSQIQKFSQEYNEIKRHSATLALQIAGEYVLDLAVDLRLPWLQTAAINVISACLTLVQDEDTDIRSKAAHFVSSIRNLSGSFQFPTTHSNVCYEQFLEYIGRRFAWSADCCQFLCQQLYSHQSLPVILQQKTESRYQQLFDQEDNSFFAEKLYNSITLHRVLKGMITSTNSEERTLTRILGILSERLWRDLDVLLVATETIEKDSVSCILSDSTFLGCIGGLVLLTELVTMATGSDCGRTKLGEIIKKRFLPRPIRVVLEMNTVT